MNCSKRKTHEIRNENKQNFNYFMNDKQHVIMLLLLFHLILHLKWWNTCDRYVRKRCKGTIRPNLLKLLWQNNLVDSISFKPCIVLNTTEHITYQSMELSISFNIVISERVSYGGQTCRTRGNISYSWRIDNTMVKGKQDKRTNNDLPNIHIELKIE
jgi:hypothetical protein